MATSLRSILLVTAALAAAVIFFLLLTLPPRAERLAALGDADLERRTVAGAFHIHTTRSDGRLVKSAVAAAAARAGLKFAIFTDHGDGTRQADPPVYSSGVLCLDGVEISTDSGHYIALDMSAAPYPLGGAGSSVVEDVARLGGFGVAAHPDSPKRSLRWTDGESPIDALEWLSADSEWRDETRLRLVRALADYLVRPAAALASLLDRPDATLARWDSLTQQRAVVALAGHDAHGGIGGAVEDGEDGWLPNVPSYEAAFRSMSLRLIVEEPLTGDADSDAALVFRALRRGRVFTAIDAVARPAALSFAVRSGGRELTMGDSAAFAGEGIASVRAAVTSSAQIILVRDGRDVAAARGGPLEHQLREPGVYRVEVRSPRAPGTPPVPWLLSNPIYLRRPASMEAPPARSDAQIVLPLDRLAWRVEHDPTSSGSVSAETGTARLTYRLSGGERASQFVALAADLQRPLPQFDSVVFTARASGPTRVSVQLRFGSRSNERWVRSVYLSPEPANLRVRVSDLRPAASAGTAAPHPGEASSLLFVIDLPNAKPGTSGWFAVSDVALAAGP